MISVLCPSRGRPEFAKRMVDSVLETATQMVEIKLYLNSDDSKLDMYKSLIDQKYYEVGPDRSPAYSWNLLAEKAKYDYLFLVGDDVKFVTPGWNNMVVSAVDEYLDKIVCVYPRHLGLKSKKNPHFCLHKNWVKTLGYFVPPQFWHWYIDTWTRELSSRIQRYHHLPNMILELELYPNDDTSKRVHNLCLRERDRYLWGKTQRWLDADVEQLKNYIKEHK